MQCNMYGRSLSLCGVFFFCIFKNFQLCLVVIRNSLASVCVTCSISFSVSGGIEIGRLSGK